VFDNTYNDTSSFLEEFSSPVTNITKTLDDEFLIFNSIS
jgi:hypothetical protein